MSEPVVISTTAAVMICSHLHPKAQDVAAYGWARGLKPRIKRRGNGYSHNVELVDPAGTVILELENRMAYTDQLAAKLKGTIDEALPAAPIADAEVIRLRTNDELYEFIPSGTWFIHSRPDGTTERLELPHESIVRRKPDGAQVCIDQGCEQIITTRGAPGHAKAGWHTGVAKLPFPPGPIAERIERRQQQRTWAHAKAKAEAEANAEPKAKAQVKDAPAPAQPDVTPPAPPVYKEEPHRWFQELLEDRVRDKAELVKSNDQNARYRRGIQQAMAALQDALVDAVHD